LVSYPNPVEDLLYFRGANSEDVRLYGMNGRFIGSKKLLDFGNYQQVNLGLLPSGSYLIQLGEVRKKIIVR
jgi:hypothetical protein